MMTNIGTPEVVDITVSEIPMGHCDICQQREDLPLAAVLEFDDKTIKHICESCWNEIWEAVMRRQDGND